MTKVYRSLGRPKNSRASVLLQSSENWGRGDIQKILQDLPCNTAQKLTKKQSGTLNSSNENNSNKKSELMLMRRATASV